MPNVKIYVDQSVHKERAKALQDLLPRLREAVCEGLNAKPAACQIVVIPVYGMPDQPLANLEVHYLGTPARTTQIVRAACETFRDLLVEVIGSPVAVRATPLIPETYVSVK